MSRMIASSEFIKGYTKIIICAYLFNHRDYLYNIVKNILDVGEGLIKLTNPSALMIMKQLEEEKYVSSTIELSDQNQARKYYELTDLGRNFYLREKDAYLQSLALLTKMVEGKQ